MQIFSIKKLSNWLKSNSVDILFPLIILVVVSFISFKNYTSNTYLTGWDNLHPEFNFKLNVERSMSSAWQEYQGVGLLGGMSHGADLPRQLFLWLTSLVVPISFIRYFWTILMLFLGPLGVYFILHKQHRIGAFVASMFYVFNLATIQYFFVPFETFVSFYGFLPWLIYFSLKYLNTGRGLLKYFLISLIATSAFYVQTLFIVYIVFLVLLSLKKFKRSFKLFLITFLANSFWLLPVLWFTFTSGSIPSNSEINRIATPETILMNEARADFVNIVNFKGYWFDYYDFGKDSKFDYLFRDWIDYSNKPYLKEIGLGLFVASILGFIMNRQIIWFILLVVGYVMLSGLKIPISVLEEAFRNSFTKWSVAFSFVLSLGLGFFVAKFKKLAIVPAVIIIGLSVYSTLPILNGKLISERVRVSIPESYFKTFDWFNNESNGGRVAYFPGFDRWGWNYHEWGYGGSGFIWYGIKNPVLDRAFNVWSPNNENYYNEITKAILDNDQELFQKTIQKYQVKYLFLDESVIFPWGEKDLLKLNVVRSFAQNLNYNLVFKDDFISIYDINITADNITSINSYTPINANLNYSKIDPIYQKYDNYIVDKNGLGLPFVNFDKRGDVDFSIVNTDENLEEQIEIKNKVEGLKVNIPATEKITESFASGHGFKEPFNCDLMKSGSVNRSTLESGRKYLAENGGVSCDYFVFDTLKYNQSYILRVKGKNITGRSLKLYLYNWENKRVELEELLPTKEFDSYFVIYPKVSEGQGYTLNVETRSFGRIASENIVEKIEFVPFDINYIQNLYTESEYKDLNQTGNLEIIDVKKYGTAIYKVSVNKDGHGLLQLGQGYEEGWVSFPKFKHVKVNSWSNGWVVPEGSSVVYLYFWPQFLEWGGFLLLLLTLLVLIVKLRKI